MYLSVLSQFMSGIMRIHEAHFNHWYWHQLFPLPPALPSSFYRNLWHSTLPSQFDGQAYAIHIVCSVHFKRLLSSNSFLKFVLSLFTRLVVLSSTHRPIIYTSQSLETSVFISSFRSRSWQCTISPYMEHSSIQCESKKTNDIFCS